jgi:hypothetical protein
MNNKPIPLRFVLGSKTSIVKAIPSLCPYTTSGRTCGNASSERTLAVFTNKLEQRKTSEGNPREKLIDFKVVSFDISGRKWKGELPTFWFR